MSHLADTEWGSRAPNDIDMACPVDYRFFFLRSGSRIFLPTATTPLSLLLSHPVGYLPIFGIAAIVIIGLHGL